MNTEWKRARSPEKKAARENAILEAAAAVLEHTPYESITLGKIAATAGFTRSNVYRYFHTREEIYFRLYLDALEEWVQKCGAMLSALAPDSDAPEIASVLVHSLRGKGRLRTLTPLLSTVLESNCSHESLRGGKTRLSGLMLQMHEGLARFAPRITTAQTFEFAMFQHALLTGLWPAANPNPTLDEVLSEPEFEHLRARFEPLLRRGLEPLLERLLREGRYE